MLAPRWSLRTQNLIGECRHSATPWRTSVRICPQVWSAMLHSAALFSASQQQFLSVTFDHISFSIDISSSCHWKLSWEVNAGQLMKHLRSIELVATCCCCRRVTHATWCSQSCVSPWASSSCIALQHVLAYATCCITLRYHVQCNTLLRQLVLCVFRVQSVVGYAFSTEFLCSLSDTYTENRTLYKAYWYHNR